MQRRVNRTVGTVGCFAMTGAIGLSLSVVSFAHADECTDPETAVEYDSSHGDTPDETADWDTTCPGADGVPGFGEIVDGVLVVNDTSGSTKAKYCVEDIFIDRCDPRQDAVYEFSCRAVSMTTNSDAWDASTADFVFSCGISTGSNGSVDDDIRAAITLDEGVGFWKNTGVNSDWLSIGGNEQRVSIPMDGTEWADYHVFRIEKHSDPLVNEVRLYLDNTTAPALTIDLDLLPNNNLDDLTILAQTSNPGKAKFELLFFRYRLGTTSFDEPGSDCDADFNNDNVVDATDLLQLLAAWGPCTSCDEDIDNNNTVGASDLLILLATWGSCP